MGQRSRSKIPMLKKFACRLLKYHSANISYFDSRLSTGPVEAFNNKIKTIQRQAYGFRDQELFKLKVYAMYEKLCLLDSHVLLKGRKGLLMIYKASFS